MALEPVFRLATPENRPKTPSLPPAGTNAIFLPTTPSLSAALPASPSSKGLLLMRTVSMKLWGVAGARRKYASTVSSEDRNGQANGNARPTSSGSGSGTRTSPPPAFQVLEEEDRVGNNRTPCPYSYTQSGPLASPRSPTKSPGRFFFGTYVWFGRRRRARSARAALP